MSIDDDARHVLLSLAQYGKSPDDPNQGRYAFEGEELESLTKLDANRLNDAVAASAITSKPATCDRLKTGHFGRSGTVVDYFDSESLGKLAA